ncbi:hypothetical protein PIB30_099290 [Stylosanthes scabra]|uniref:Uncharacterized protein n=1 Tax=Stylosanthes scabra TaxID=79078 RepID=A0ABU6XWI0_9FABA|nr:hypothetical protein [Stylosanthes scabra]
MNSTSLTRSEDSASEEDLLKLWAMVQEKQIHWPYLMAHRMLRYSQGKSTSFLAHAHLLTKVFEIAPLDLTREDNVEPETSHAITSKNIHQMRRNLVGPANIADDVGIDVGADAQPHVETAMTEGFTRLSGHIDQIDAHLISQDMDIPNLWDEFRNFHGERILEPAKPRPIIQHSKSYYILWTNFTNSPTHTTDNSNSGEAKPNTRRMLRQLSKLEPVPEKSEIYGMRIPNPWILSTDKASKPQ